jgi:hypothetical protein
MEHACIYRKNFKKSLPACFCMIKRLLKPTENERSSSKKFLLNVVNAMVKIVQKFEPKFFNKNLKENVCKNKKGGEIQI